MKKKLLLSLGLVITSLFVGSSVVKADTITYKNIGYDVVSSVDHFYNYSYSQRRTWYDDNISYIMTAWNYLYNMYTTNYETNYPYYTFNISLGTGNVIRFSFNCFSTVNTFWDPSTPLALSIYSSMKQWEYRYTPSTDTWSFYDYSLPENNNSYVIANNSEFYAYAYFFSNFKIYYTNVTETDIRYGVNGLLGSNGFLRDASAPVVQMYDYFELTFLNDYTDEEYTTYNLNDYSYIILSFKDYNNLISPTYFDVKGQFCPTVAYDYGQQPKETVTDICSVVYDDYTPTRLWTTSSDLQRHVIYYLKAYDTNIINSVKINTSVFNVTPVTSADADSPTIYVGNRPYSPIPYDDLPSTATGNTENGYVPGASCGIGDIDCVYETGGLDISDLFTHPLQLLQTVWGSITSVFLLITAFIALMPATLQVFLYSSFMLAIILGIIKIIIG